MDMKALSAPFPPEAVHWRAQSVTKDGTKALALAYIDARDVMDRLDEVCGPENWQTEYLETAKGRLICRLSLRIGDEWVTKSDGAGETQVEGDKGAISDALKRAAVSWGIGRYLYRLPAPWVPCECGEWKGKKQWRKWKADPWQYVKGAPPQSSPQHPEPEFDPEAAMQRIDEAVEKQETLADLTDLFRREKDVIDEVGEDRKALIMSHFSRRKAELQEAA